MDSQKLEDLLNLALDSSPEEREKSLDLNVGYNEADNVWELIVKYNGDLSGLDSSVIKVEQLIAGYAIVTIPQNLISSFVELEEIEFVEMPKRFFFNLQQAKEASCILPVTIREPSLSGSGTIIAIIDSGIDYARMDFRRSDGSSRILYLWDQSLRGDESRGFNPPEGFFTGVEFNNLQINEALSINSKSEQFQMIPSLDVSGHGTSVAAIAAGNGMSSDGRYVGVAPESDLIVVKLGIPGQESFPRTTELMRALTYVVNKAAALAKPVAINLSFGNTYGAHDGTSLLERFIDNVSEIGRNVMCVESVNEGEAGSHASGNVSSSTGII